MTRVDGERGDHEISERYGLLFRSLGFGPGHRDRTEDPAPGETVPAAHGTAPRSRLETLSAGQLDELIGLLDDQWHALVRTDNLLGPRHALGGVHDQLDQAHEHAASPDDPGDASAGHCSFCTPAYVEMQRGRCWLRLGQPAKARAALDGAVRSLPPVYRRDRGVALSALATAFAALGEPAEAAATAAQALGVAREAGSERIVSMVIPVTAALAPYRGVDAVARLQEALAGTPGA